MNLGSLRVRKGPLYRARVSVRGCVPADQLQFSFTAASGAFTALRPDGTAQTLTSAAAPPAFLSGCEDFLVKDLSPGSYEFALQGRQNWALTPMEIVNKNLFLTLTMAPDADITGTVLAAYEGMSLPSLDRARVLLGGLPGLGSFYPVSIASLISGKFSFQRVRGPRHALVVAGLGSGFYVKGSPLRRLGGARRNRHVWSKLANRSRYRRSGSDAVWNRHRWR